MKRGITEPPDDDIEPMFKDPPLKPHSDAPLDEKGRLIEEQTAKSFTECLKETEDE